ncbi:MAG: translation initiation factor IF-2 [Geminicoccaceae bacterium]|nr:translation initiation factor IF-2 [Geminicoccaceae bacterium]
MSDAKGQDRGGRIELNRAGGGKLELKPTVEQGTVRQSFSHGRSKAVAVEVKKRRIGGGTATRKPSAGGGRSEGGDKPSGEREVRRPSRQDQGGKSGRGPVVLKPLTDEEKKVRLKALSEARKNEEEARKRAEENARRAAAELARRKEEEAAAAKRKEEENARREEEEEARRKAEEQAAKLLAEEEARRKAEEAAQAAPAAAPAVAAGKAEEPAPAVEAAPADEAAQQARGKADGPRRAAKSGRREEGDDENERGRGKPGRGAAKRDNRRGSKLTLGGDDDEVVRGPSPAKLKRQRERERQQKLASNEPQVREVIIPETITVQELAARMAIRGAEVVKVLMRSGVMATINQSIDADTAEIVVGEFGHSARRVSESDVEVGLEGAEDREGDLRPRAPVVTVMGHVDHGKTSLLDALRKTDVVSGEAGGITQHIGAYQVDIGHGTPVAFIDTPGHAAFTAMRARGASVTDIVVLVVAADDGVMPQTIEAIQHAKAAQVPIVVAVNKCDLPASDPSKVKQELLSHDVVVEEFGGDIQSIEVSALKRQNLDKLIEAIQLQAELLELKANPDREAQGFIIEARLDRGRGVVATVLVQKGTLRVGDIVIAGAQWGRVRALVDDHGGNVKEAGPSVPVEILGLDGVPEAGDVMSVVENERKAREIVEYRQRKRRSQQVTAAGTTSLEDMFNQLKAGEIQELPVVIKSDVHGSLEAIQAGLDKIGTDEARVRILSGGVGGITESDVTLAQASSALIVGFNVRANAQARELARREGLEIRYYSIIYELLDEMKAVLSGMLAPEAREVILGHAEIREVFSIPRVGKIAGCMVVDGLVRRQARARLLRDDVVIYEGELGSLKRFKDDAREVRQGFECGMSIEGYNDIRQGDLIETYEVQEVARTL